MDIEVRQVDATQATGFQALVVPANRQLTLGWGSHLAEKVLQEGGAGIEKEALERAPGGIRLGEAVITSAGNLKSFTHVIHAVVLDKWDMNPLFLLKLKERTSEATLRGAVRSSLERACEGGLESVVLTPMGAGIGGMKDHKCARIMVEELRGFERSRSDGSVTRVLIAVQKEGSARASLDALKRASP